MRVRIIGIITAGLMCAACGDTMNDRMLTAGLGGAGVGALIGGPVGAIVGGGVGVAGGAALDKSADEKINEWANQPSDTTPQMTSASGAADRGRAWSAEQVDRKLRDDGYARVYNIRREDGAYLARGERDGRAYDVKTDAYTGRIIASSDAGRAPSRGAQSGTAASGMMSEQPVRDRGRVITLSNVLFRTASADPLPGAATSLDPVASFIRAHPDVQVEVDGHTDSTGSADRNQDLSQRRANAVRQALVTRGVDPTRIVAQGMGETAPIAPNDTAEGRQLNRRVEVLVSGPGLQTPQASGAPR
jgi:outer membrane protein OmpA-like peptidoglycan-associated protein